MDTTYVYEGVTAALTAISSGKERPAMAVLSNKPVNPSRAIVQTLGLAQFFGSVYGGNSFESKKPDPLGVQVLLKEYSATPEQTVIIGDSDVDVLTAKNAGIYSLGVTYGLDPESLKAMPPDVSVDTPAEWHEVLSQR